MSMIIAHDDNEFDVEAYVRRYLEDTVQKHVKIILEHQLQNIVTGELARLKLLQTSDSSVESCVASALDSRIDVAVRNIVQYEVATHLRAYFSHMAHNIGTSP